MPKIFVSKLKCNKTTSGGGADDVYGNRSGGAPAAHHPKRSLRIKCLRSRRELTINKRTNSLDY